MRMREQIYALSIPHAKALRAILDQSIDLGGRPDIPLKLQDNIQNGFINPAIWATPTGPLTEPHGNVAAFIRETATCPPSKVGRFGMNQSAGAKNCPTSR